MPAMSTIEIPSLREAFATLDHLLVYREAKRQYEAFLARGRPFDLAYFYYLRFELATAILEPDHRRLLLRICFAYQTRARVLAFLDLLASASEAESDNLVVPAWVAPLKHIMQTRAEDSLVLSANNSAFAPTTLPLAYPTHFLSAYATHVDLPALTSQNVLDLPATRLLALSPHLGGVLRMRLAPREVWTGVAREDAAWAAFFGYLGRGKRNVLCGSDGRVVAAGVVKRGYGEVEIEAWVKVWRSERTDGGVVSADAGGGQKAMMRKGKGGARVGRGGSVLFGLGEEGVREVGAGESVV